MVFVLNIGNTNIQYGVYNDGDFVTIQNCPTSEFTTDIINESMPVVCASVVPEVDKLLIPFKPFFVKSDIKLGFDLSCVDSTTIGADRIANTAALSLGELPAICVDCGTALTFEVLDSKKRFLGGAISPGRAMMRKALNDHSSFLPKIVFNNEIPDIGSTTAEAIAVGVDRGIVGTVKEIVTTITNGTNWRTVAVVGDAEFLVKHIPYIVNAGDEFTMLGIVTIWNLNK